MTLVQSAILSMTAFPVTPRTAASGKMPIADTVFATLLLQFRLPVLLLLLFRLTVGLPLLGESGNRGRHTIRLAFSCARPR